MNWILGRRIHQIMWDRSLKQTEISRILGIGQSPLSKKLRGERDFDLNELFVLCDVLQIEPATLFRRPGPEDIPTPPNELPRLDSNQQPFDCRSTARVTRLADWRTRTRNRTDRAS